MVDDQEKEFLNKGSFLSVSTLDKSQHSDEEKIIRDLAAGDMAVLDRVYLLYRDAFLKWAGQKFRTSGREDLLDAWHDTMLNFYHHVRDKKLTHLTCELKTYLFLIGYHRLLKIYQKAGRTDLVEEPDANIPMEESFNVFEMDDQETDRRHLLRTIMNELPDQSRRILQARYVEGKSVPDIMQEMGYTSVNAVSVTLSRTLKRLKESIVEKMATQKVWKKETRS